MVRLFKCILFAWAFASAILATNYAFAQSPTATPTPSSPTNNATGTPTAPVSPLRTGAVGNAAAITTTEALTTPSATILVPTATAAAPAASTAVSTPVTADTGPLEGTIFANRSDEVAQFFLEGQTYLLAPGRSQGITLPRATTVLNLFNCAGDIATDTPGCYWDPYLVEQDGFYEIYNSVAGADQVKLMLREAGAPPTGQVFVQNRTQQTESVVFKEDVYEIEPTAVMEFPVATGVPAILYVRSCLTIDNQSACEWSPKTLNAGVYYAMVEVDVPGSQSGSMQANIDLRPVVGENEAAPTAAADVAVSAPSVMCSVVVPALNIRSGPGLQYDIIGKVRANDGSAATVQVTGRSADNEWLTVDPAVAAGGWINNSPSFITCASDVMTLPVIDAPAQPTPAPSPIVETPPIVATTEPPTGDTGVETPADTVAPTAPTAEATGEAPVETPTAPAIPAGQALLIVNNGFQHEMRFTLDQQYRPQDGPSEYDLQPGQSLSIVVYPGDIPFTGSTPWSGLSGNASVHVEADQSLTLWLRFEPEPGGNWVFRWN